MDEQKSWGNWQRQKDEVGEEVERIKLKIRASILIEVKGDKAKQWLYLNFCIYICSWFT